ncbi:hypothetical protein ACFWZY_07820 [Streptomyces sp. NPDC058992]|uniref:hypothetical protein n=1 Tax=Streptomyces sp. NPDC058992 TaxID=3346688 RepID=UPI0036B897AD
MADEPLLPKDCHATSQDARPGTLAAVYRDAKQAKPAITVASEVRAYENAAAAETYLDDTEDGLHRCPTQQWDKEHYEGLREGPVPELSGFDEMVPEVGRRAVDETGRKVDQTYVGLMGRKGEIIMGVSLIGPSGTEAQLQRLAADALQRMHERLAEQ